MLGHTSPECDGDNNQGCAQYFAAGPKPCAVFGVLEHGLLSSQWQRVFRARYVLWQASSALLMAMCEMGGGGDISKPWPCTSECTILTPPL